MRDFRDAASMAKSLRTALAAMGSDFSVRKTLELIAQPSGHQHEHAIGDIPRERQLRRQAAC
jgi:hypothetical protein